LDDTSIWKLKISCHFLHLAKTEDIWLKSALKVERDILLTSGRNRRLKAKSATSPEAVKGDVHKIIRILSSGGQVYFVDIIIIKTWGTHSLFLESRVPSIKELAAPN
jgi:hypothetical protein